MIYRRFGRTELRMPVFSCGGMRYQYKWEDVPENEIPEKNQQNLEAVIRRACELGIHHVETARGYGSSEMQLGHILPALPRDRIIVQTKVGPLEEAKQFRETFEKSLAYLRLEYVDLLALHGVNNRQMLDWSLRPGGCLDMARRLRDEGFVRHIGFSTHAPTEIILEAIETGAFDYVNLHWYFIFQKNWKAVQAARRHDMGVFIISPSDKGGKLYDPPARLVELCKPLSPMVFNDLFCLSHPEIHTLSLGAARPGDFDEHLKALPLLEQADAILPPILERLRQAAEERLGADWLASWDQGLPSWDQTPGNLNIPIMLWLRNLALSYDMTEYGKMRYNLLGSGGHWFPGEKLPTGEAIDLTSCLADSPHAGAIPTLLAEIHEMFKGEDVKRLSEG